MNVLRSLAEKTSLRMMLEALAQVTWERMDEQNTESGVQSMGDAWRDLRKIARYLTDDTDCSRMTTIRYADHKTWVDANVRNIDALPKGLNCKYLLTIRGEDNDLIAKAWKRKKPAQLEPGEVLIEF